MAATSTSLELTRAARQGDTPLVRELLLRRANPDSADAQGVPALCRAAADKLRRWLAHHVAAGNPVAIRVLGQFYEDGASGLAKDEALGLRLTHRAADLGNGLAMLNLGCAYYFGRGVEQDHEKTVRYYRRAAEKGVVKAISNLSLCYRDGEGVEKDAAEAARLEELAESKGYMPGFTPGAF